MNELKTIRKMLFYIFVAIFAGMVRVVADNRGFTYHSFLGLIYMFLFFQWGLSIKRRFIQKHMRFYLSASAFFMCFWIFARTVKYEFVSSGTFALRLLWYSYYIPMMLLPMFMFLATLYIGKTEKYNISKKWNLLFIPVFIEIVAIFTNDLHQKAFVFYKGYHLAENAYKYGFVYYIAYGMFVLFLLGIIIMLFTTYAKKRFFKAIWLPTIVVGFAVFYFATYESFQEMSNDKFLLQTMFELPEFTCLFLIAFWESLVYTGMIPSNKDYDIFFESSSINAGIADDEYKVVMQSGGRTNSGAENGLAEKLNSGAENESAGKIDLIPNKDEIRDALSAPVLLNENFQMKSHAIKGGYFYWIEDISEITELNKNLVETRNYLEDEYAMLDAKISLQENMKSAESQNKLYSKIESKLKYQMDEISRILDNLPEDENGFQKEMKRAAIINAYIKRMSNLYLMSYSHPEINLSEFMISIEEVLYYVDLYKKSHEAIDPEVIDKNQFTYTLNFKDMESKFDSNLILFMFEGLTWIINKQLDCLKRLEFSEIKTNSGFRFCLRFENDGSEIDVREFENVLKNNSDNRDEFGFDLTFYNYSELKNKNRIYTEADETGKCIFVECSDVMEEH